MAVGRRALHDQLCVAVRLHRDRRHIERAADPPCPGRECVGRAGQRGRHRRGWWPSRRHRGHDATRADRGRRGHDRRPWCGEPADDSTRDQHRHQKRQRDRGGTAREPAARWLAGGDSARRGGDVWQSRHRVVGHRGPDLRCRVRGWRCGITCRIGRPCGQVDGVAWFVVGLPWPWRRLVIVAWTHDLSIPERVHRGGPLDPGSLAVQTEYRPQRDLGALVTPVDLVKCCDRAVSAMAIGDGMGQYDPDFPGGRRFTRVGIAGPAERTGDIPLYRH
jgi:hypothetical protein